MSVTKAPSSGKQRLLSALNVAAIMTLFMYSSAGGFESAAIQTCIEAWPDSSSASIRLMMTLPALVQSAFMPVLGLLLGRRLSYRAAAFSGMALIALGGCLPILYAPSWSFVLILRGIGLGIGGGMLGMRNTLLLRSVPAERSEMWIGLGTAFIALMSVISSPICGWLTSFGWQYSFLINAFSVPCLVVVTLFLKEPEALPELREQPKKTKAVWVAGMNRTTIVLSLLMFVTTGLLYAVFSVISTYFAEKNIGSAALAGVCMSIYSLSGMGINLLLAPIQRLLGRRLIGWCSLVCALGIAVMLFLPGSLTAALGLVLCGIGYFPLFSMLQVYNNELQPPALQDFSSLIILTGSRLAIFFSNYFISISGRLLNYQNSEASSAFLAAIILFLLTAVIGFRRTLIPQRG